MEQVRSERAREPWGLRRIAEERGTTPVELLRSVLRESSTYVEAARKLGVSREALRKYCQRYGLTMVKRPKEDVAEAVCPVCQGTGLVFGKLPVPGHSQKSYGMTPCEHPILPADSVDTRP